MTICLNLAAPSATSSACSPCFQRPRPLSRSPIIRNSRPPVFLLDLQQAALVAAGISLMDRRPIARAMPLAYGTSPEPNPRWQIRDAADQWFTNLLTELEQEPDLDPSPGSGTCSGLHRRRLRCAHRWSVRLTAAGQCSKRALAGRRLRQPMIRSLGSPQLRSRKAVSHGWCIGSCAIGQQSGCPGNPCNGLFPIDARVPDAISMGCLTQHEQMECNDYCSWPVAHASGMMSRCCRPLSATTVLRGAHCGPISEPNQPRRPTLMCLSCQQCMGSAQRSNRSTTMIST